ncbi:hypothetical protein [Calothrix rhizosoleniae]|uniref:hypothetical protein n=1 Tax=Calothrix rhizosoleniae TaxID=888997 RepID=UPI000B49AA80|nr:hypothetical protein [Calothrix rhizosoleniae]
MPKSNSSGQKSSFFSKINVIEIVANHLSTLKEYRTNKKSISDLVLFFVFPFLVSLLLVHFRVVLNKELVGVLINVFAIFAGLLFNLLVLVYDAASKASSTKGSPQAYKLKLDILEQIYFNISFEILLSLLVVLLLAASITLKNSLINNIFSALVFYLIVLFTLTFLMILKRVNVLLSREIEHQKNTIQ